MNEALLTEQLDQAIEAMLGNEALPAPADPQIAELVTIAGELCELPRAEFKARLKSELERETSMEKVAEAKGSVDRSQPSKIREGFRTVTPYVVVSNVHEEIDFIKKVFGAKGKVYGLGS